MAVAKDTTTATAPADPGVIERVRKPKPMVSIPATQAKSLAKALDALADDMAAKGDGKAAQRIAKAAAELTIAARFNTTTAG